MIAIGAFSPLTGFMEQEDYGTSRSRYAAENSLLWSIPITLSVEEATGAPSRWLSIWTIPRVNLSACIRTTQKYHYDKVHEATNAYR